MPKYFQEKFLGMSKSKFAICKTSRANACMLIGRYWLERLYEELTYVSSFEQDTTNLKRVTRELVTNNQHAAVAACLEEHLFYRLGKEIIPESGFSSLVEQIYFTRSLGIYL